MKSCLSALLLASRALAAIPGVSLPLPPAHDPDDRHFRHLEKRDRTWHWGSHTFKQLLDHSDPSKGTFQQTYWFSTEFWKGPGAPVVLFTPGELNGYAYRGYLFNGTIVGVIAQNIGAATVVLEHRFYNTSSPYSVLSEANLTHLTLANAVKDLTYFANNVRLPFDKNGSSNARNAPWVLSGGSYAGALAAWISAREPGTFWAYHATSAVVNVFQDFWQWFEAPRLHLPTNCSTDLVKVIDHVDNVLLSYDHDAIMALKKKFGLERLMPDDFAAALLQGPFTWQSLYFNFQNDQKTQPEPYVWCDAIENVGKYFPNATKLPGADGVGLEKALNGYALWFRKLILDENLCYEDFQYKDYADNPTGCFDTYNSSSPLNTDASLENTANRQWFWMTCNDVLYFWRTGAPWPIPTIASRVVNDNYWNRQCAMTFPNATWGGANGKTVEETNAYTGGWKDTTLRKLERIVFVNGEFDPWLYGTVSSPIRPGGQFVGVSNKSAALVIPGGFHCSDLITGDAEANPNVKKVVDEVIEHMKTWVEEYYTHKR